MRGSRFVNPFRSEAEIAALTRQALEADGWEVWPETYRYDLFARRRGRTLGVECKLDAVGSALAQGVYQLLRQMQRPRELSGAHVNCLALASARIGHRDLLNLLGIAAWQLAEDTWSEGWRVVPRDHLLHVVAVPSFHRDVKDQLTAPDLRVEVPAGVPSPRTVSAWKIRAVEVCLRLAAGEAITRQDLPSPGLWLQSGWVEYTGERVGRRRLLRGSERWRERGRPAPPHVRWPEIVQALAGGHR